jgi:3,4-dihydroxy 2-butanone 4-phosphate synthase/GTP cyclohydrolase II
MGKGVRVTVKEVARVPLPTPFGLFETRAFECGSGFVYLAMVKGSLGSGESVLARVHSECLTGDVFESLRCDCGVQLRVALKSIAAEGRGVLIYATGHEGRGIGLTNKLRAYMVQDRGADTVDANMHLGLPVDGRRYRDAADVLRALEVRSVRLMTNNPEKVTELVHHGIVVSDVVPLAIAPHFRNSAYLSTKRKRLGHNGALVALPPVTGANLDVRDVLGPIASSEDRPYVVIKYAQSLDGRIATSTGDSRWISGGTERTLSHSMRAHCDAIMVGIGTVINDDPQLTVRLVPGSSPTRVIVDSTLRIPDDARVLEDQGTTIIATTKRSPSLRRRRLAANGSEVVVLPERGGGVDLAATLKYLRTRGVESLLVEGGAKVITSLLGCALADRLVVSVAPRILGSGTEAVGELGVLEVSSGLMLHGQTVFMVGEDLVVAADLVARTTTTQPEDLLVKGSPVSSNHQIDG